MERISTFILKNPISFYTLIIVFYMFLCILYVYLFPFEYAIQIKAKSNYASGKSLFNTISDSQNNVYEVANAWPLLHFRSAEVFSKLETRKTFRIRGYGLRISFIGLFPNIVSAVEV